MRVEENLGDGYVRLKVAEAERRQAKQDIRCVEDAVVELLRNSRDAHASRIFLAFWKEQEQRKLLILDDGEGIPQDKREAIFEARVTSKLESFHTDAWGVHGRGMALYSIRENACEAYVADTCANGGSAIKVVFDTESLSERADQSTWPELSMDADGALSFTGPHNIIRTCCEFAIEEQSGIEVYIGSAAEVTATICKLYRDLDMQAVGDGEAQSLAARLAAATSAQELCECARSMGLEMSERNAHRILSGEIRPQESCFARLAPKELMDSRRARIDISKHARGLKVAAADIQEFAQLMAKEFEYLAERYYLGLRTEPAVRVTRDRITVTFDIENLD